MHACRMNTHSVVHGAGCVERRLLIIDKLAPFCCGHILLYLHVIGSHKAPLANFSVEEVMPDGDIHAQVTIQIKKGLGVNLAQRINSHNESS